MFTVFATSFLVIIFMLAVKMYEVWLKRQTFSTRILSRFDTALYKQYRMRIESYDRGRDWALLFIRQELPRQSKEVATLFWDLVYDKYRSILPNVRGMRTFRHSREASPFLRDIQEHQEKNGKGRIED